MKLETQIALRLIGLVAIKITVHNLARTFAIRAAQVAEMRSKL